eukprot:gene1301-277_t
MVWRWLAWFAVPASDVRAGAPYFSEWLDWPPAERSIGLLSADLGNFHWNLTDSENQLTIDYCDQGWGFMAAFDFRRAVLSFRSAYKHDRNCAMCLWAEAFCLGPNLNTFDNPNKIVSVSLAHQLALLAYELLQERETPADEHNAKAHATRLQLGYALTLRYRSTAAEWIQDEMQTRIDYAQNVDSLAEDGGVFEKMVVANAWMNTHPWDYWIDRDGARPETTRALNLIEECVPDPSTIFELRDPHDNTIDRKPTAETWYSFACHLYIHLTEASVFARKANFCAEVLSELVTAHGHLWHMGSHTFLYVSRDYSEAIRLNKQAIAQDFQIYPEHNIEMLLWFCRVSIQDSCAHSAAAKLADISSERYKYYPKFDAPFPHSKFIVQQPLTMLASHKFWQALEWTAEKSVKNSDQDPDLILLGFEAFVHGVAHAKIGNIRQAEIALDQLVEVSKKGEQIPTSERLGVDDFRNFGGNPELGCYPFVPVMSIAQSELRGHIAKAKKDLPLATTYFHSAWEKEKLLPASLEPPEWYMPSGEKLGYVLLEQQMYEDSENIFKEILHKYPGSIRSMKGLYDICVQVHGIDTKACELRNSRYQVALRNSAEAAWNWLMILESADAVIIAVLSTIAAVVLVFYFRYMKQGRRYEEVELAVDCPPEGERSDAAIIPRHHDPVSPELRGRPTDIPPDIIPREVSGRL